MLGNELDSSSDEEGMNDENFPRAPLSNRSPPRPSGVPALNVAAAISRSADDVGPSDSDSSGAGRASFLARCCVQSH